MIILSSVFFLYGSIPSPLSHRYSVESQDETASQNWYRRDHGIWNIVSILGEDEGKRLTNRSATIASIVKTVELKNLVASDFTWSSVNLVYWFTTENYTIIIAACIPTLRPLFEKWFRKPDASSHPEYYEDRSKKAMLESGSISASSNNASKGYLDGRVNDRNYVSHGLQSTSRSAEWV